MAVASAVASPAIALRAKGVRLKDFMVKNYVVTDSDAYALAVALLASPLFIQSDVLGPLLLVFAATLSVYLGSCAPPLMANAPLTLSSALAAPLFLAFPLLALYAGPKMGLAIILPYKELVCLFGAFVGLETLITNGQAASRRLNISEPLETSIISVALASSIVAVYLFTSGPSSIVASNLIAWSLAVFSIRVITVDSFLVTAVLLLGCLCYDAFFVFGTDVMASVVKQVDAPVVLRMSKSPDAGNPTVVLGLGDVVIPGVGVAFLRCVGEAANGPYFTSALAAYAAGVLITLGFNTFAQNGQPALLYVVPCILASAFVTAAFRGELSELLTFRQLAFGQEAEAAELGEDVRSLQTGTVLVAREGAEDDGTFGSAAVLLLEHDHAKGSLGVVLNCKVCESDRRQLVQVLQDCANRWLPEALVGHQTELNALALLEGDVRVGGPVAVNLFPFQGSIVLHSDSTLPGARVVLPPTGSQQALLWSYIGDWRQSADPRDTILTIGLSSWGAGQLAGEVRRGTWALARASLDDLVRQDDLREYLFTCGAVEYFEGDTIP